MGFCMCNSTANENVKECVWEGRVEGDRGAEGTCISCACRLTTGGWEWALGSGQAACMRLTHWVSPAMPQQPARQQRAARPAYPFHPSLSCPSSSTSTRTRTRVVPRAFGALAESTLFANFLLFLFLKWRRFCLSGWQNCAQGANCALALHQETNRQLQQGQSKARRVSQTLRLIAIP
jgi:hypothetical protein